MGKNDTMLKTVRLLKVPRSTAQRLVYKESEERNERCDCGKSRRFHETKVDVS